MVAEEAVDQSVFYPSLFFNTSSLDGKNKLNKAYFYFCCSEALRTKYTFCNLQLMIFNRRKKSYEIAYIHSDDNTCVRLSLEMSVWVIMYFTIGRNSL